MDTDVLIVGGGPAGMMAGLLFARAGVRTLVLEKHGDFLRDFRGDTVHPWTIELFHQLGCADALLARRHDEVRTLRGRIGGEALALIDFTHLPVRSPFVALMPQWDFLDFVAQQARAYPAFALRMECEATGLIEEDGRIVGVTTASGKTLRAKLVIAADGRRSVLRGAAALPLEDLGAPMDALWFRLPKNRAMANDTVGIFDRGRIAVLLDRGDYWQCAWVIPKGGNALLRARGLDAFRLEIGRIVPEVADVTDALASWDAVKLLGVALDRLTCWHRPGLLAIGDAAHAMSPVGGVGINLAVQDAVAAANILAAPLAEGRIVDALLARVQARRARPTRRVQGMQRAIQNRIIGPVLSDAAAAVRPPLVLRLLDRFAVLRRIPAAILGYAIQPERIGF